MRSAPRILALLGLVLSQVTSGHTQFTPNIRLGSPSSSPNAKRLICVIETGVPNVVVPVINTVFYLNGEDVTHRLTGGEFVLPSDGVIDFELSQDLEGCYTCGNGSYTSPEEDALKLVSRPTPNTDIDRYHTVAVGGGVKLECGIKQGALGSMYEPQWFHNKSYKVDTRTVGSRFQINRNFLEDLSLNIAFLNLRDNGTYHCDVEVGTSYAEEGLPVELLVYENPVILYMTDDQILSISNVSEKVTQQFICNATGTPALEITWKHNDKKIGTDKKYSIRKEVSIDNDHLTAVHSVLTINDPALTDSGTVVCVASISFRSDGPNNLDPSRTTTSVDLERELIVLDTSLEPHTILTQASDLLVRIELRGIAFSKAIKVRVRLEDEEGETEEFDIDGVFLGVSTFYPFIPASRVPTTFRRFWVQVSLAVNNVKGPFNPPEVSATQFIDYDEEEESSSNHLSEHTIIILGTVITTCTVVGGIIFSIICIGAFVHMKKSKIKREKNVQTYDLRTKTLESTDKTMVLFKDLLDSTKERISRATDDEMNHINKEIDQYSAVLADLARAQASGLVRDDGLPQIRGTTKADEAEETPVVDESEVKKNAKARIEALLTQVNDMATKSTS